MGAATIISGGNGNDIVKGGAGYDILRGGAGEDTLIGASGDDWLMGGRDDDFLYGGEGSDTFVFGQNSGHDVVMDFEASSDKLDISSLTQSLTKPVLSLATETGSGVQIMLGDDNSVVLANTKISDLTEEDFLL